VSAHTRFALALGACAVVLSATASACGQKAAPDVDPVPKRADVSTTTTSTMASTTTTVDPGTLPQTNDKPDVTSAALRQRIEVLWKAIVANDPKLAVPSFFPLAAYLQVKDVKDPAGDWNNRLIAAFNRDIASYHKQLTSQLAPASAAGGAPAAEPVFVGVDVPAKSVQWINPNVEYNKIGYFRVFDSKLNYTVNGKPHSFLLKSLISWRGELYVVHLASI
jgi:hypothetical protein